MSKSKRIIGAAFLAAWGFSYMAHGQALPSHGATAAGVTVPFWATPEVFFPQPTAWQSDIALEFMYLPSPDDDRFDDALGLGVSGTISLQSALALRLGVGYESFQGKTGFDDADIVPLGLSFLIGPPLKGPFSVGLELGLRYSFVDFKDDGGSYDNSVNGIAGLILQAKTGGFILEISGGYRYDISASKNDEGDKLSLEGLALKLAIRIPI